MELQFPLEKELNTHVEFLTKEEEDEVQACIEELDGAKAVVSLSLDRALSETQPLSKTSAADMNIEENLPCHYTLSASIAGSMRRLSLLRLAREWR